MKTLLLFAFASLFSFSLFAQDATKQQAIETGLIPKFYKESDEKWTLEERMAHYKVPAVSIAVIDDYNIVFAQAYGMADNEADIAATTETAFQAASLSKSVNAVGVFQLADKKQLDLNADINDYLTSWKFPYNSKTKGKTINTLHLLSHTAGLSTSGFPGYQPGKKIPTVNQILDGKKPANTKAVRSLFAPGLRFQYSGGGTTITQKMIEDITGKNYADYMQIEVLDPLGMSNSFFHLPNEATTVALASAHWTNGERIKGKYHLYPESAPAALWTTPTDMAKFIIGVQHAYEGKDEMALSTASAALMMTPPLEGTTNANGVFIEQQGSTTYFEHNGSNEGFKCHYTASLSGGKGVVVMVNSERYDIIPEIVRSVANAYDWEGYNQIPLKSLSD
nr:beta-lactamase family protein [Saprospiraceae bacterium]